MNTVREILHDLRQSACHEAGHFIVASHFRLNPGALLIRAAERPTSQFKAFVGKTFFDPTTSLRKATIAFAGVLAEEVLKSSDIKTPKDLISTYHTILDGAVHECSASDREGMMQYPRPWRPFRTAAGILLRKRDLLEAAAKRLEKHWCVGNLNSNATEMYNVQLRLWAGYSFTPEQGVRWSRGSIPAPYDNSTTAARA